MYSAQQKEIQFLQDLLSSLRSNLNHSTQISFYTQAAVRLSKIAGKSPPWTWRYIMSVDHGSVSPSKILVAAALQLAAQLDGAHPLAASHTESVQVYSMPGQIKPDSIILPDSKYCANPSCVVSFVPSVPWQIYCNPTCRPGRKKSIKS